MRMIDSLKSRFLGHTDEQVESDMPDGQATRPVVMYSTKFCPYCMRARSLLQQKRILFRDVAVDGKPALRQEMVEKSGRFTVPQIWIGDLHIGGCDELMQLERTGALDGLLKEAES